MLDQKSTDLFQPHHYQFSTLEAGGTRLSSLYFQDAKGVQGRWRRQHPTGELLVYQGKSLRLFIRPDKKNTFVDEMEDDDNFARKLWMDLRDGLPIDGYSAAPITGYHVIELVPPAYFVGHSSSGTVLLNDPTAGNASYIALANYTGTIIDWTAAAQ
mgnify:CR=1 FL=1